MKFLKPVLALVLSMGLMLVGACTLVDVDKENENKEAYTFVMPDGSPALAAASLMNSATTISGHPVTYKIVPATQIGPEFTKNADIAIMPTNAAATLFNKGVPLKLASVNVFGSLYMVGSEEIASLEGLKGKVVCNIGQGKTPDLLLKYFLTNSNVEYVESAEKVEGKVALTYANDGKEAMGSIKAKKADYAVLGQPVVTTANNKLGTKTVFDFQAEWNKINKTGSYPQAGVVVKANVAQNKEFMAELFNKLSENVTFINEKPEEIKGILAKYNSTLTFDFNKDVVSSCNIDCKKAFDIKDSIVNYYTQIAKFNDKFIGGKLPADDYYLEF